MSSNQLDDLAARIEATQELADRIAAEVSSALAEALPPVRPVAVPGASDLRSTDFVLHLIDRALPGWTIHLSGKALEPDGHWSCHLRPSASRDDDEVIGHSKGATLSNVLLAGLLRVLAYLKRRHKSA